MVYYHVWDNYPYPDYNKVWYNSCDHVACISKVTHDIVKTVAPETDSQYIPHAVDSKIFKPIEKEEITKLREQAGYGKDEFIIFWNNRNARRKQPGSLIFWFDKFLKKVGGNKAKLIMHTDPNDPNGPDLIAQINKLGLTNGEVRFSKQKVEPQHLASMYNMADVTVNIADAEGFGLATLESLSCGTPIIVTMTGGLQEQVTDGKDWFGIGIEPSSKTVIGSQEIPFIYEDRINEDDFVNALEKIYKMSKKDRQLLGLKGREHVMKNYNFDNFSETWRETIKNIHNKFGSWETRVGYKTWELLEV
jgi:glycosyltransferase involved in cell wall biosynthesis